MEESSKRYANPTQASKKKAQELQQRVTSKTTKWESLKNSQNKIIKLIVSQT